MKILVIGRGLLGRSVCRLSNVAVGVSEPIPWESPSRAGPALRREIDEFAAATLGEWGVAWCAGAGIVGSAPEQLAIERSYLSEVLDAAERVRDRGDTPSAFFMASSAGGVYGAGSPENFNEGSAVSPRSAYGEHKLEQERLAAAWARRTSTPTLIGRISNLYGGDQDLTKRQGFVSHICRSIALRKSFVLSAPADTQRDFLYADDAALRILGWFALPGEDRGPIVKILSADRPRTLSDVIRVAGAVSGIHPRVVMAANPASRLQPRYLRFRSVIRTDLDLAHPARGLEVGMLSVWHHTLRARASGRLS